MADVPVVISSVVLALLSILSIALLIVRYMRAVSQRREFLKMETIESIRERDRKRLGPGVLGINTSGNNDVPDDDNTDSNSNCRFSALLPPVKSVFEGHGASFDDMRRVLPGYEEAGHESEEIYNESVGDVNSDLVEEDDSKIVVKRPAHLRSNGEYSILQEGGIYESDDRTTSMVNQMHMSNYLFIPTNDDEIRVSPNDQLSVFHEYAGGWLLGINWRTHQSGVFPKLIFNHAPSENGKLNRKVVRSLVTNKKSRFSNFIPKIAPAADVEVRTLSPHFGHLPSRSKVFPDTCSANLGCRHSHPRFPGVGKSSSKLQITGSTAPSNSHPGKRGSRKSAVTSPSNISSTIDRHLLILDSLMSSYKDLDLSKNLPDPDVEDLVQAEQPAKGPLKSKAISSSKKIRVDLNLPSRESLAGETPRIRNIPTLDSYIQISSGATSSNHYERCVLSKSQLPLDYSATSMIFTSATDPKIRSSPLDIPAVVCGTEDNNDNNSVNSDNISFSEPPTLTLPLDKKVHNDIDGVPRTRIYSRGDLENKELSRETLFEIIDSFDSNSTGIFLRNEVYSAMVSGISSKILNRKSFPGDVILPSVHEFDEKSINGGSIDEISAANSAGDSASPQEITSSSNPLTAPITSDARSSPPSTKASIGSNTNSYARKIARGDIRLSINPKRLGESSQSSSASSSSIVNLEAGRGMPMSDADKDVLTIAVGSMPDADRRMPMSDAYKDESMLAVKPLRHHASYTKSDKSQVTTYYKISDSDSSGPSTLTSKGQSQHSLTTSLMARHSSGPPKSGAVSNLQTTLPLIRSSPHPDVIVTPESGDNPVQITPQPFQMTMMSDRDVIYSTLGSEISCECTAIPDIQPYSVTPRRRIRCRSALYPIQTNSLQNADTLHSPLYHPDTSAPHLQHIIRRPSSPGTSSPFPCGVVDSNIPDRRIGTQLPDVPNDNGHTNFRRRRSHFYSLSSMQNFLGLMNNYNRDIPGITYSVIEMLDGYDYGADARDTKYLETRRRPSSRGRVLNSRNVLSAVKTS